MTVEAVQEDNIIKGEMEKEWKIWKDPGEYLYREKYKKNKNQPRRLIGHILGEN